MKNDCGKCGTPIPVTGHDLCAKCDDVRHAELCGKKPA